MNGGAPEAATEPDAAAGSDAEGAEAPESEQDGPPADEEEPTDETEAPPQPVAAGARAEGAQARPLVRAVQMAMAGASRDEIGDVLRDEYQVTDPESIVDEALGRRED